MRALVLTLCILAAASATPAWSQQPTGGLRGEDYQGLWAARPGGTPGVEIRLVGRNLIARELIRSQQAGTRCGTEGRGRLTGTSSELAFRGTCDNGRRMTETRCTVRLVSRTEIRSQCRNGHTMTLHKVRG